MCVFFCNAHVATFQSALNPFNPDPGEQFTDCNVIQIRIHRVKKKTNDVDVALRVPIGTDHLHMYTIYIVLSINSSRKPKLTRSLLKTLRKVTLRIPHVGHHYRTYITFKIYILCDSHAVYGMGCSLFLSHLCRRNWINCVVNCDLISSVCSSGFHTDQHIAWKLWFIF